MKFGTCIVPSEEQDFLELGATRQGRLFRKHILNKGPLFHPNTGEKIDVDDAFVAKLKTNFDSGVCPIVQVPLAGPKNEHTEAPDRNIGQVVGIEEIGNKVYALFDARKHADDIGKTLLGASAMMSLDYTDTNTLKKVGPTLLHMAVTNRPYVTGLDDYSEVVAASSEYSPDDTVLLTPVATLEDTVMTKDELLAELKAKHNLDVAAIETELATLKAAPPAAADAALTALTATLVDTGLVQLSNGENVTGADVVAAVAQLATDNVALSASVKGLFDDKAKAEVAELVATGFILPANQEAMTDLRLSNAELFAKLVPDKPIIELSREHGTTPPDSTPDGDVDAAVTRYLTMAAERGMAGVKAPAKV